MNKVFVNDDLSAAIRELEIRHDIEKHVLINQLSSSLDSLKPSNLIQNAVTDLFDNSGIINEFVNTGVSQVAGHLAKKWVIGSSRNPFKKIFGVFIQIIVTNIISKCAREIQSAPDKLDRT